MLVGGQRNEYNSSRPQYSLRDRSPRELLAAHYGEATEPSTLEFSLLVQDPGTCHSQPAPDDTGPHLESAFWVFHTGEGTQAECRAWRSVHVAVVGPRAPEGVVGGAHNFAMPTLELGVLFVEATRLAGHEPQSDHADGGEDDHQQDDGQCRTHETRIQKAPAAGIRLICMCLPDRRWRLLLWS